MMCAVLRWLSLLLVPCLALGVGTALPASADDSAEEGQTTETVPARDFALTAHRGSPRRGVGENTFEAFRDALRDGATAIETDLRRTRDDQFVVLHDSGVGRTTNCGGPIGAWTLQALTRECRDNRSHKPIPTGAELLDFLHRTDATAMIELKGSNWSVRQIRRVVRLIERSDAIDQVAISSLRLTVLQRVRGLSKQIHTQLIVSGWPKVAASLGEVSGYNVPASALTRSRVKRLHRKELLVVGGQADSPAQWARLARLEVDGVVATSVRKYRRWARS